MARKDSVVKHQEIFRRLVENAFDFLDRSIEEIEERPKYSLIHFYAAVELFLKARLASEHWSLVVTQRQEADWQKFVDGDFRSVSLEEAAKKLDKVIRSGLTNHELRAFQYVAKHRNEAVHFFHKANYDKNRKRAIRIIVKQQLHAWYFLHRLLRERWKTIFDKWDKKITNIDKRLRKHKAFLQIIFEEKGKLIQERKNRGALFNSCPYCGLEAQEHINKFDIPYMSECLVCGAIDSCLKIKCSDCQSEVNFVNQGFSTCIECQKNYEPQDLAYHLSDKEQAYMDKMEGDVYWDIGSCDSCVSYQTVVRIGKDYLCACCFEKFDCLSMCEWCNELNTGDMEHSYLLGCNHCEGLLDYTKDE